MAIKNYFKMLSFQYVAVWFESCAAMPNHWHRVFTLHCSSSLSCMNEYLAIDIGGYMCRNTLLINKLAGYFTEKFRWFSSEDICQAVKCKVL